MIQVKNLSKHFGSKKAVDNISFDVPKGQVLGFLGPNGAGKSTTMRMITGFFPPHTGTITISGIDILNNPVKAKQKIGYLPENAPLYADMTVTGFLTFSAELRGLSGTKKRNAVQHAIELCFLQNVRHQSVDTLSKGYKHRTCLAQSLIHDPEILILDEPTDGLDPNQKHEVRNLITRLSPEKVIIFSTHILEEVEAVCTRAIIIDQGKIVADDTPDALRAKAPNANTIRLTLTNITETTKQQLQHIPNITHITYHTQTPDQWDLTLHPTNLLKPQQTLHHLSQLATENHWTILNLHIQQGRLDDMFRTLTTTQTNAA